MGIDPDFRILMLQLDDPGRDALERVIARAQTEAKQRAVATTQPQPQARERKSRRPGVRTMIRQAERAGKNVSKITTPDGTVLSFGEPQPTEANNPWLADLDEVTKQ
ncbi:MAG TPA: hypothetical protein VHJ16_03520 [Xanthobacteraceae bacterium]|jgi:hypothetical protein|nr:hypothetical protein [Xanthobacteraceae bacterium]